MLILSLFLDLDLRDCMKIVRLSLQMKRISTYKIFLCICEESNLTKIATLINFHNALIRKEYLGLHIG